MSIFLKAYLDLGKLKCKNICTYGQGDMYRWLVSLLAVIIKTLKIVFQCPYSEGLFKGLTECGNYSDVLFWNDNMIN